MGRPKNNLTPEEKRARQAAYALKSRAKKASKPSVTDPTDKVQLKVDIDTYLKKLVDVKNQILAYALNDWCRDYDYHDKPSCIGQFTMDKLVVDEMQEAARLKAKAQAFYDEKIRPHTLEKALQDAIEIGSLKAKTFKKDHDLDFLSEALTTIIDSLPTEENLIEDLKNVCRDAYRHEKSKSYRDLAVPPIPHSKNVRPTIVTPHEVNLLNFALVFDQTETTMDELPENFPPRPAGLDKTLHRPETKTGKLLKFIKKKVS